MNDWKDVDNNYWVDRRELKPIVGMYEGHDASLVFYLPKTDDWVIYELEKVTGKKHFAMSRGFKNLFNNGPYECTRAENSPNNVTPWIERILGNLKKDFGVENDFLVFHVMPIHATENSDSKLRGQGFDYTVLNCPSYHRSRMNHHEGHTWAAYMTSPFSSAAVLSWDAGGDNTLMMFSKIKDGYIQKRTEYPIYRVSYMWQLLGMMSQTIVATENALDYAGKMMGLSAYGKKHEDKAKLLMPEIKRLMTTQMQKPLARQACKDLCTEHFSSYESGYLNDEDSAILCYAIQKTTEDVIIELIREEFIDDIREMDSQLIITGGTAMNILANEAIKEAFPDITVCVPCNPSDDGISCGLLEREKDFLLYDQFRDRMVRGWDFKYKGPYLLDHEKLERWRRDRGAKETNMKEVASLLKQGKIIGFLNDRSEVGPRSLGNRSILCDPSQPNMKDTLNAKVKFREWFRPFAPMCKLEDADKYFDSRDYEFMDAMQFGIKVKPEWQSHLTEITHEDGTARLQVVTSESNPVVYELLDEFDGVLLNTSFNVQGKPILNTIGEAMYILDKTELDHVVIVDKTTKIPYLF